ncbi:hypothetical protein CCYA_CCYA15G4008 [Cyanidiococcus yangmingshanensis]|nr:hypothetical protein CCYA_CCYA15G4008 [Cyanidiococcus yangmingshanensis]
MVILQKAAAKRATAPGLFSQRKTVALGFTLSNVVRRSRRVERDLRNRGWVCVRRVSLGVPARPRVCSPAALVQTRRYRDCRARKGQALCATAARPSPDEHQRTPSADSLNVSAEKRELSAQRQRRARLNIVGIFFLLVTFGWSLPLFVLMLVLYPFVLLFDPYRARIYDWVAMTWMQLSMRCTGISPCVVGKEHLLPPDTTVLYVCNHNSYLDIYTVAFLGRRFKFVSKSSVFSIPLIGWAMRMARQIGIERESRRDQLRVFREMISRLEHGVSLLLFPEGTRSQDGILRAFKQGPFRVAKEARVPIVPLTITGTAQVMPPWALAPLCWPREQITLTIHPAISSTNRSVSELIEAARVAIASALPPALRGT